MPTSDPGRARRALRLGVQRNHGYLEGVGGVRLEYRAWEAAHARAGIVLIHGLSDHSGRYDEFGAIMASYGISCFAADLRGHGASEGRRGYVARFDVFLQDADRFRREVQGLVDPSCRLFLLGHSMGGLIALRYLEEYESAFDGGIIASPWLATALPLPRWKTSLAPLLARFLPTLPMRAGISPHDLSHDEDVVRAYAADPLVHDTITPRLFGEISANMGLVFQRADRLTTPLLFLIPGNDRLVDANRTNAFARSLPRGDVTIRNFPGLYHELLNELERQSVTAEIRDWISARLH